MSKGTCANCKRKLSIVAKGLCGTCYAKSRKAARAAAPAADQPEGEPDFNALFTTIRQMVKGYRSMRKENLKLTQKFSDLKMKFIVMSYKKWTKKYQAAMQEMQAALKDLPQPDQEDTPTAPAHSDEVEELK